jgi:hypothetical protein
MDSTQQKRSFTRDAAADIWRNTLSQIPSIFGRMVYLASLRNSNSGEYEHHGVAQFFGTEQANRALADSHMEIFGEWLCMDLQQQKCDLDIYLSGLEGVRRTVLSTWLRLEPYRGCVPGSAREVERELYLADLETLLELLRNEYGVANLDRDA